MYKLSITRPAEQDILSAVLYIAHHLQNKSAAEAFYEAVQSTLKSLEEIPYRYPVVNDEVLAKHGFRLIPIKNSLVFYIVREATQSVVIERVLYYKRNWLELLLRSKRESIDFSENGEDLSKKCVSESSEKYGET